MIKNNSNENENREYYLKKKLLYNIIKHNECFGFHIDIRYQNQLTASRKIYILSALYIT